MIRSLIPSRPFSLRYPRDITWSVLQISKTLRLSEHTVRAIRQREAQDIAERKKSLAAILANVAELGAEKMEATIGKASLRDAAIGTGVAVDKMLALTGQMPSLQIANIWMPSEEERAERGAFTIGWTPSHETLQSRASPAPSTAHTRHQFSEAAVLFL